MSEQELKELSKLLNEFRKTIDEVIFYNATDFAILKSFIECAMIQSKDINHNGWYTVRNSCCGMFPTRTNAVCLHIYF